MFSPLLQKAAYSNDQINSIAKSPDNEEKEMTPSNESLDTQIEIGQNTNSNSDIFNLEHFSYTQNTDQVF